MGPWTTLLSPTAGIHFKERNGFAIRRNKMETEINQLSADRLLALLQVFAKNWLAHDGLWFQAVEKAHDLDEAMKLDAEAWHRFSPIEAGRIKTFLALPDQGGLEALEIALRFRLYAVLNKQRSEFANGRLRFYMSDCRVQSARKRKGLPDFPCKAVGRVEYSRFATAIDSRIKTECIACLPGPHPDTYYCGWEFRLES